MPTQLELVKFIPDHHPGFIAWDRYQSIQTQLRANWRPPRGQGGGAAREGTALLQGRLRGQLDGPANHPDVIGQAQQQAHW